MINKSNEHKEDFFKLKINSENEFEKKNMF